MWGWEISRWGGLMGDGAYELTKTRLINARSMLVESMKTLILNSTSQCAISGVHCFTFIKLKFRDAGVSERLLLTMQKNHMHFLQGPASWFTLQHLQYTCRCSLTSLSLSNNTTQPMPKLSPSPQSYTSLSIILCSVVRNLWLVAFCSGFNFLGCSLMATFND